MKKDIRNCMTSELLFQAIKDTCSEDNQKEYIAEYERRLRIMGLSDVQIAEFRKLDEDAIKKGCYMFKEFLLTAKPMIMYESKEDSIKLENCTFSELVYLTDDANAANTYNHEWFSKDAWKMVKKYSSSGNFEAEHERKKRMDQIGISEEQGNIFVKNECMIIERTRWRYAKKLAWE